MIHQRRGLPRGGGAYQEEAGLTKRRWGLPRGGGAYQEEAGLTKREQLDIVSYPQKMKTKNADVQV